MSEASSTESVEKYYHQITLNGHVGPINCVRFAPQELSLASGGDDGYVFLWSLPEKQFTHKFHAGQGPIIALEWFDYPNFVDVKYLVSAGADGTVKLWKLSIDQYMFIGMHSVHEVPIENVALHYNRLAIVGGCHLTILNIDLNQPGTFSILARDPEPPSTFPALARTVHFTNSGRSVIVGHLDAKTLSVWNVTPWKKIWKYKIATRIGNTAWCESTQTLLVWNLCDGIDIYRIDDRPIWISKLAIKISRNMVVQVSFGIEPFAISGSDSGEIYVWNLKTCSLQQVLHHDREKSAVQAVSFNCLRYGRSVIASASSETGKVQQSISIHSTHPINEWPKATSQMRNRWHTNGTRSLFRQNPSGLCIFLTIASLLGTNIAILWMFGFGVTRH